MKKKKQISTKRGFILANDETSASKPASRIFLIGLPASGKTHTLEALATRNSKIKTFDLDCAGHWTNNVFYVPISVLKPLADEDKFESLVVAGIPGNWREMVMEAHKLNFKIFFMPVDANIMIDRERRRVAKGRPQVYKPLEPATAKKLDTEVRNGLQRLGIPIYILPGDHEARIDRILTNLAGGPPNETPKSGEREEEEEERAITGSSASWD